MFLHNYRRIREEHGEFHLAAHFLLLMELLWENNKRSCSTKMHLSQYLLHYLELQPMQNYTLSICILFYINNLRVKR